MEIQEIDYGELEKEVIRLLEKIKHAVLATCAGERVTARTMSCVSDGLTVYCQTESSYTKCKQIVENPNVALCAGNMQLEGAASILGHPFADANRRFAELFKEKHPGSFSAYSHLENEVVIGIEPKRVVLWKYDASGASYRDFLELADGRAYRQFTFLEES
jgi:general stress protein 26